MPETDRAPFVLALAAYAIARWDVDGELALRAASAICRIGDRIVTPEAYVRMMARELGALID